jgi:hypothetical protein
MCELCLHSNAKKFLSNTQEAKLDYRLLLVHVALVRCHWFMWNVLRREDVHIYFTSLLRCKMHAFGWLTCWRQLPHAIEVCDMKI